MNNKTIEISIYLPEHGFVLAGKLILNNDFSCFEYDKSYIKNDFPPINPSTLNWREHLQQSFITTKNDNKHILDRTFWEMLPNQNDWGNQVLTSRFPEYQYMNNAEKLYFLGDHVVGGMKATINKDVSEVNVNNIEYLDKIRDESLLIYENKLKTTRYVGAIKSLTSYGGVRPKCMYEENGEFWIVKFNLPDDPYDMAIAEQIAMDMSRDVGLKTADSKIVKMPSGENAFFSKRFDRDGEKRFHSLSLFSLVPGNEGSRKDTGLGKTSGFIQTLIKRYSDFENIDTLNIVTKMLLDIGVNNTDNHLRNLRMILNKNHKWELSPMYDIIFNPHQQNHVYNPAGLETSKLYLNNPEIISAMSKELSVPENIISEQREKVIGVLENWETYCDKYNMEESDREKIGQAISIGLYRTKYTATQTLKNTINFPKPKPI